MDFWSLGSARRAFQKIGLLDRQYARVGGRTPLPFSANVRWSPTEHPLTKSTIVLLELYSGRTPKVADVRETIHRIHWVILDCTKQHFDRRVIVPDIRQKY